LVIEDVAAAAAVVEVRILIYSVDKVEWVYVFVDKVELKVCLTQNDYFHIYESLFN
jgi:hypothetical protein